MLNSLLEQVLINGGSWTLTVGRLLGLLLIFALGVVGWKLTRAQWRLQFYSKYNVQDRTKGKFELYLKQLIVLIGAYVSVKWMHLDPAFYNGPPITLHFSLFLLVLIILIGTKIVDWVLTNILTHSFSKSQGAFSTPGLQSNQPHEVIVKKATKTVRYILVIMVLIMLLRKFDMDLSLYQYDSDGQVIDFRISKFLLIALILKFAKLISWMLSNVVLYGVYRNREIDEGSQYAVNQILKYIIYLVAFFMSLNSLGINMTLLLGGAAALLVGVGLGLQQTFNDFFSGLVLLFERSVSVGDILTVDGVQGSVKKIGMRSSIIETLGNRNVIIPNSKLVNEHVLNWNHYDDIVRFDVSVGVAYGSDTSLVKDLLIEAVTGHLDVVDFPKPFVRFTNFGDSSLDFTVFFFSDQLITTENIKSDIRFKIDKLFREHNVSIPFPQRDVWMREQK